MSTPLSTIDEPQNARSRATRRRLLDAAWDLLARDGPAGTTLEAVTRAAGVSRRALYLHFRSRAELLVALRDHIDAALDLPTSLAPIGAAPDAAAAVGAWAAHVAGFHSKIAPVVKALDHARHTDSDVAALWERAMSEWHGESESLVRRIQAEGRLTPPWSVADATDLLWSFMSADFVHDLVVERGWTVEELAVRLATVVRRTLMLEEPNPTPLTPAPPTGASRRARTRPSG